MVDVDFVDTYEEQVGDEVVVTDVYADAKLVGRILLNTKKKKYSYNNQTFNDIGSARRFVRSSFVRVE